ncbi:MAG TPA: hypothetical protein VNV38_17685 [Stellaceae bacterium]|jgi:hypothetical protein|nr:hypothetical protein [Stellaceae bacterium]
MNSKLTLIALPALLLLVACSSSPPPVSVPQPAAAPTAAPPPPPPAPEPAASNAPIPIRGLSCGELLGASDDDRAAASMFFIGYQAALAHLHNLSISEIEGIEQRALTICAKSAKTPAVRAFGDAISSHGK